MGIFYKTCLLPIKKNIFSASLLVSVFLLTSLSAIAAPPRAHHLYISGTTAGANPATSTGMKGFLTLKVWYTFTDPDAGNTESGTTYQWYTYTSELGTGKTPIAGATSQTYFLTAAEVGKFISVEVRPRDNTNTFGNTVEFRAFNSTTLNSVLSNVFGCSKAGGGTVSKANAIDNTTGLCSPRSTTWDISYTGIDYNNAFQPRIFINWGDGGGNIAFVPTLDNPLTTLADTLNLTFMANQKWKTSQSHIYSYTTTGGTSVASTVANQVCTYTLSTVWGVGATPCPVSNAQTQPFTVWDRENNTSLGTFDINHDPASAGVETGEITDICAKDQSAIRVLDASDFNCTNFGGIKEGTKENDEGRWIQWVYGTAGSNVTTGAGVTEKIIINGVPYDFSQLPVYGRVTYQPGVTDRPLPSVTDDIRMPTSGIAGEVLMVTMRSWNTCNKLDRTVADGGFNPIQSAPFNVFDITNTTVGPGSTQPGLYTQFAIGSGAIYANNAPVTRNYTLRIITKPPIPVASNKDFCAATVLDPPAAACGSITTANQALSFELTAAGVTGSTVINWYFGNPLSGGVALNGNTGVYSGGTNCRFFRPRALLGSGAQGTMRTALTNGTTGVYSLWATYSTANGCTSDPVEVKMTIRPALTAPASPTGPIEVCNGASGVTFSQGSAAGNTTITANNISNTLAVNFGTEYLWSTSNADVTLSATNTTTTDATFSIATQPNPTATRTITTALRYSTPTTSGAQCNVGTNSISVTVYGTTLGGTVAGGTTICDGAATGTLTLSGHRGSILRWEKDFNGSNVFVPIGATAGLTTYSETPSSGPGTYRYRAVIRNGPTGQTYNCSEVNSTPVSVVVNAVPPQPTIGTSGPTTFCFGGSVTLTSSNVGSLAAATAGYQWYKDGVAVTGQTNSSITLTTVAQSGSYTVKVIGVTPSNCESPISNPTVVTINPLPSATVTGGGSACSGVAASDIVWTLTGTQPFNFTITSTPAQAGFPIIITGYTSGTYTIVAPNPAAATNYEMTVLTDANTCPSSSLGGPISVTPQLVPPPAVDAFTGQAAVCDDGPSTNPPDAILDLNPNSVQDYAVSYRLRRISTGLFLAGTISFTQTSTAAGIITVTPTYAQLGAVPNDPLGYQVVITAIQNVNTGCAGAVPINGPTLIINPRPATPTGAVSGIACSTAGTGSSISVAIPTVGYTIAWSTTAAPTFTAAAGVTGGTRGNTFTPGSNATATYHAFTKDDITPTNCLSSASLPVQHIQDVTPTTSIAGTNNANCTGTFTLGGNTPNTGIGEIGTWTVPGILYNQNFSGYTNQATSAAANGWSRNVSAANVFTGGQGYFQVTGGQFELNNADGNTVGNPGAEVVWLSPVMTGTVTNLSISVDLSSSATHEAGDYLKVFYKLNGGAEVALTNGNQLGNITGTVNATATGLNGTSIQFVVRANNNATDEFYRFDNILMSNAGAPIISNPNDRLATVTNLPVGANVLTWTISSLYGVCPVSLTTVTLTRHPLPTVNTVTPSLCEDLPGGGSTGGVLLSNYDILVADEAGAPVALPLNTTVEYYSAATRLPGNQITAATTIINGQTVFTRVRNSSTTCSNDGTMTFTVRSLPAVTNHSVQICEDTPPGSLQATGINLTSYEATITGGVANRDVEWYNDPSLASGNLIPAGNASGAEQNYSISADVTLYAKVIDTSSSTIPPCFGTATMLLDYQGRPNNNLIKDASNTPVGATYTICASTSLILLQIDPSINPGATYTWNVPTPVPSTQFELLTGTTGYFIILKFPNAIPSPGIPISVTEKLGTAACAGNTLTTSVIVEGAPPKPVITGPSTVCSEANGIVFSVPFVGGSTYSWSLPPGATITSLPVTSNSITVQMSTFSGIVTVVQSSGNGCTSPAADPFPVAVVNRPTITSANSNVLCSGENVQVVHTLTSNIAGTTYNWKVVGITGFVTGSILNDSDNGVTSINQTLTNTSGVTASVTYQVTPIGPTSGASPSVNCPGTPQNLTITVNPEPVLNLNSKVICSNEAAGYEIKLSPNNLPSGTTFSWGPPVMSSGPAQGTAGSSVAMGAPGTIHINDIFTNTTTSSITATYLITAQSGLGCASNQPATSREVVITINPRPVGANDTQLICSNAAVNYDLQNNIATLGNNLVTGTTYSWVAASNVNVSGESQTSQLGATISDVLRNVTASNQVVLYTVTPVSAALCTGPSFTVSVTVRPEPRGYNDATPVSCSDVALSYGLSSNIANTGLGGNNLTTGTTYSWTAAANPNVTGESVSPQSTTTINDIITNVTSSNQTVVYTVIPTSSLGCTGNAFTVSFTIRPEPKGFDDATPIICSDANVNYNLEGNILNVGLGGNGLITGTTYSWIAMANPSVTGESITSQPGKTITDVLNNVTNADQQVVYTVTPISANGCSGDNFIITITVRPEPKGFNDTTPVICSDDAVNYSLTANIANTVSGGNNLTTGTTFSWIAASNANVGGESTTSQLGNTITDILNNVTNTDRVVIYTVTPSSANGCPGDPFTVSVTVHPEPRGYNDNTPFVCSDGAVNYNLIANVANTGLGGNNLTTGTTFSWIAASNVNVGGESTSAQLSSSINDNLTNVTNTNQFVVYTVTPSSALSCMGNSFVITITVRPEPRGFDDPSPLVCSNDPINYNFAANVANTGAGGNNVTVGTTFSWVAADNANTIGESTTPQSGSVINNVIRNATNTNQVVIYTITPTSADGCDGDPFIVSITVKPEPKGYNDTTPFTCSDVAFNYDLSLNVANVGLGGNNLVVGTTYSWIAASNGNVSGESLSAQAGSIITDVLNNVTASNQVVIYTVTPTSATGCVGASFTVSVEVRPEPKGFNDNATFICSDATVNYNLVANVSNTGLGGNNLVTGTTFNWIAASNSNVTGESTTIQGGSTITDALNNVTNSIQVVDYTVTPTSSLGCIGNPFTISINVRPEPKGYDDTTPVICSDASVNYNLVTNISNIGNGGNNLVTGTTFSWIAAANPNVSGESNVTSGTASSITDILNNITSGNEVVVYTVTPRSSDGCFGNPFTVSVTVRPEPKGFNDTTPVACSDIALNYDLTANIANTVAGGNNLVTGTTYTWVATPNANVGGESSGVTDHITDVLNNVTNINQIVVYTVTPVSADGCTGNPFTVSVTVRPEPRGFADNTPLICSDGNVNYDLAANIGNTVSGGNNLVTGNTYSWIAVNNPNVTGESFAVPGTGSVINDVLNNVTNTNQVVTYTVIPTSSLGCAGNSFTVTVTVRPEPRGFDDSTPVICSDAAVNYDLALNIANLGSGGNNLVTGTTYSWIAASNPNVTGETTVTPGTSQVINDVLNNVTNANQFVIYTVTPTSTNGCPGNPFTISVTVQPEPKGFNDNTPLICSDDPMNYPLSGNIANTVAGGNNLVIGTTYTWIAAANANVTGESLTTQSGNTITDVLNNVTNANQVVVYTVTPKSSNNCVGDPFTVSVTVRPEPKGFNDNTPLICSDDPVNYDLVNNILNTTAGGNALTTGTTYSWIAADNPSVTGESLAPVATSSITDVLVNASGSNQVVVYTVTPTSGNLCTGNTFQISVTVRSKPVGADDNSPTVCSDEAISYNIQTRNINTLGNLLASTFTYTVVSSDPANVSAAGKNRTIASNAAITDTYTNLTSSDVLVTYTVTPFSNPGNCVGTSFDITFTIHPEPKGPNTAIQLCSDAPINYNLQTVINTAVTGNSVPSKFKYSVTSSNPLAVPAGPNRNTPSAALINDVYTNLSSADVNIIYTVTPYSLSDDCEGTPFTLTVTVHPEPVGQSIVDPVCSTLLNHDIQSAHITNGINSVFTYTVSSSDPIGVSPAANRTVASNSLITDSYTNTTGIDVTVTYTITPFSVTDNCEGTPFTYTVTISSKPVGAASIKTAVCSDVPFSFNPQNDITNGVVSTFTWTAVYNGLTVNGAAPPAAGTGLIAMALTNLGNTTLNAEFTVLPKSGNCDGLPYVITVPILPEPVVATNLNETKCSGDAYGKLLNTNGTSVGAATYDVTVVSKDAGLTGGRSVGLIGTGNSLNNILLTDAYVNTTATPLKVVYSVVPHGTNGCTGDMKLVEFTINPEPVLSVPAPPAICSRAITNIVLGTNGTSINAQTYRLTQIEYSSNSGPFTTTAPADFTFPATNKLVASSGGIDHVKSDVFTNKSAFQVVVRYTIVPVSPGTPSTPLGCDGDPAIVDIAVNPEPILDPAISPPASRVAICSGDKIDPVGTGFELRSQAGSVASARFIIRSISFPGLTAAGTNAPVNVQILKDDLDNDTYVNVNNIALNVTYTIAPISALGCIGEDSQLIIVVNPAPSVKVGLDRVVCSNAISGIVLEDNAPTSIAASSYEIVSITSTGLTADAANATTGITTDVNRIRNDKFINLTNDRIIVTYQVVPISITNCRGPQTAITLTVEPVIVSASINNSPNICSATAVNIVFNSPTYDPLVATNPLVTFSYKLVTPIPTGISGYTSGNNLNEGEAITDILVNSTNNAITVQYQITPRAATAANGTGCPGTPEIIDVIVQPRPKISAVPNKTVCEGSPINLTLNSLTVPTSGVIKFRVTAVAENASVTGFTSGTLLSNATVLADVLSNSDIEQRYVDYTFEPINVDALDATICANGIPVTVRVTVNPRPDVTPSAATLEICSSESIEVQLPTDTDQSATIVKWTALASSIDVVGESSGAGDVLFQTLLNKGNAVQTVDYTITPSFNGCDGPSKHLFVTVNPIPTVALPNKITVCGGTTFNLNLSPLANTAAGQTTFKWEVTDISGIGTPGQFDGTGTAISQAFVNNTDASATLLYQITPIFNGSGTVQCEGIPRIINVSVAPTITAAFVSIDEGVCEGTPVFLTFELHGQSPFDFVYSATDVNGTVNKAVTKSGNVKVDKVTPTLTTVYKIVSAKDALGCEVLFSPQPEVTITVYQKITAAWTANIPPFVGGSSVVNFTNTSTPVNGTIFNYDWSFGTDGYVNPLTSTQVNPAPVTYTRPGDHYVSLTASNKLAPVDLGCESTFAAKITIPVLPLFADFKFDPKAACFPQTIKVTENTATGAVMDWEVKDINGGIAATSNAALPEFLITNPGKYTITLRTFDPFTHQEAFAPTTGKDFVIYDNPVASFDVRPTLVYVPDTELTTFNFSTGAPEYLWDFGDGSTSTEPEPKYTYKIEGIYDITLIAMNDHGDGAVCADTLSRKITAKQGGITKVPNAFTPNPNGPSGGIAGNNTFNDVFLPLIKGAEEFNMQIFDRWGNLIFESNNSNIGWDGYDKNSRLMPAGVYVYKLTVRLSDGQRSTQIGDITMIR